MDEKDLLIQVLQQQRDHFLNENVRLTVVANKKLAELEERLKALEAKKGNGHDIVAESIEMVVPS